MVTKEQVEQKNIQLQKELALIDKDIITRFPLSDYLNTIKPNTGFGKLLQFYRARKLRRAYEQIKSQYGTHALALYLKLALCCFISDSLERMSHKKLPGEIVHLYHEWFEWVLDDFSKQPDDYYNHRCISFVYDVMICSLRYIPIGGAWIVEIRKVGLRPFFGGGVKQFFSYLYCIIFKAHGFSPYIATHTAERTLQHFNEHEMNLVYQRIAELMKLNPKIKGFYRRSWFLDPQLEDISPWLGYLRKVPQQNGVKLFPVGTTKKDIGYAIAASRTRRRLYERGKYLPTAHAFIWPRKDFLLFAEKNK
ncbi:MAG: hypothetical protein JXA81_07015 [Sedimentisphaerales bacterium]|nr:hypothetical protein [Sedimentisphaerales bacterium]